jgi:hypothetical protein
LAVALIGAATAAGCGEAVTGLIATDVSAFPSATPLASPSMACPTASQGTTLADASSGFEMVMPSNWRQLHAGAEDWLVVEGSHDSQAEAWLKDGTMQDFAAPVLPQDEDKMVNLSVYVAADDPSKTLTTLGNEYAEVLRARQGLVAGMDGLQLPAGPTVRVTATYPHGDGSFGFDDRLVAYIVRQDSRLYYLVFVSRDSTGDQYADRFLCMARSFSHAIGPATSPSSK